MTTTLPARRAARRPAGPPGTLFATLVFLVLLGGDVLRNGTGWWGWGLVCGVMVIAAAVVVVRHPPRVRTLPRLLVLWLAFAVVSLAWSQYPAASAIGIVATLATTLGAVAVTSSLPWPSSCVALGRALRLHVVASLLFELVVACSCAAGLPRLPRLLGRRARRVLLVAGRAVRRAAASRGCRATATSSACSPCSPSS